MSLLIDRLDEWEANAYEVRRRYRSGAANTPIDDELPEQPWRHLTETRHTLAAIAAASASLHSMSANT